MGARRVALCPFLEATVEPERLDQEQHERKENPNNHHGMQPPIGDHREAVPRVHRDDQVKATTTGDQHRDARDPGKAPLDRREAREPVMAGAAPAKHRQERERHERDPVNPDNDRHHMKRAAKLKTVHDYLLALASLVSIAATAPVLIIR